MLERFLLVYQRKDIFDKLIEEDENELDERKTDEEDHKTIKEYSIDIKKTPLETKKELAPPKSQKSSPKANRGKQQSSEEKQLGSMIEFHLELVDLMGICSKEKNFLGQTFCQRVIPLKVPE